MIRIDPRDGTPIYRQVIDQVKLMVVAGQYAPGEQLESVSSLAARLKVNPMTISKAYGNLVQEGLVERRRGVGLFVARLPGSTEKRIKTTVLQDALRKAASLAVQMGIGEKAAADLLAEAFDRITSQKVRETE